MPIRPEQAFARDPAVVEDQLARLQPAHPHQLFLPARREPRRPLLDQEQADPLPALALVDSRDDDGQIADQRARDESLRPVEHVPVPLPPGGRRDACDIRAGPRLGLAEHADLFAAPHGGEILLLLALGPVPQKHVLHEFAQELQVGHHHGCPRQLLLRNGPRDGIHARPAIFGRQRHRQDPEVGHSLPEVPRKLVGPVDLGRPRLHLLLRERANRVPHHALLVAELEVHGIPLLGHPQRCWRLAVGHGSARRAAPPLLVLQNLGGRFSRKAVTKVPAAARGPSRSPVNAMRPPMAWAMRSWPRRSRYGPVWPYPEA
jgi:hypothetical protein